MINKKFDEKYNFWIISCDEGEVISDWSEEENITDAHITDVHIIEYSSFKRAYCPKDADLSVYHTFTTAQDEEYNKLKREAEEKRMKEEEAKIKNLN